MSYRAKSAERVFDEIIELSERHKGFHFEAVDNILEQTYVEKLFPVIADIGLSHKFFFEVKSNLSRKKLELLARGGVERVQPGIESLNTHVLKLMDKGVTAAANVNFLRWCKYYGIDVGWNVLWGFPGENKNDYDNQADLFKKLFHLAPPNGGGRVWLERFSPMYKDRERFPIKWKKAEESYNYVYPKSVNLDEAAYFFEFEFQDHSPDSHFKGIKQSIMDWQKSHTKEEKPALKVWNSLDFVQVEDSRDADNVVTHTWHEPLASVYRMCMEKPISVNRISSRMNIDASEVVDVLDHFVSIDMMMKDEQRYLALAIPN